MTFRSWDSKYLKENKNKDKPSKTKNTHPMPLPLKTCKNCAVEKKRNLYICECICLPFKVKYYSITCSCDSLELTHYLRLFVGST